MMAEACGNRTHPGRLSATRNGFEARENHQAPFTSARCEGSKAISGGARRSYFLFFIYYFLFSIGHWSFVICHHLSFVIFVIWNSKLRKIVHLNRK
jgi:hypothetical protein